jgi:pimeloyl-ACP methyl ester carboxylesterase
MFDIEAVRRKLGLERWTFWGMSGGGWLAQLYAHRHPESLTGAIIESVCPCFRARLADPECLISPLHPQWKATLQSQGLIEPGSHDDLDFRQATEWIEVAGVGSVFRRVDGPALLVSPMPVDPHLRRAMPVLWTFDARAWLSSVASDALVIGGGSDPIVPLAHVRRLHEALPHSNFVEVADGGHVPSVERHPQALHAVRKWLEAR